MHQSSDKNTRLLRGKVISIAGNKTVIVLIERKVRHPLYGKIITKSAKFHVHDEYNSSRLGDAVVIVEARRISKTKSWIVNEII